jgi:hypothetical protein
VNFQVDPVGLRFEHMVTADPKRTPTLVAFARPDYFLSTDPAACSTTAAVIECPPSFGSDAWMHGDLAPEINVAWAGLVGPGIRHLGQDGEVWSDHADLRPTILLLAGLRDDYAHQGRPLWELVDQRFLPRGLRDNESLLRLGQELKQIDAPVGALGLRVVRMSNRAITGGDERYAAIENEIAKLTGERDEVAGQIIARIEAAAFGGRTEQGGDDAATRADSLLRRAAELDS